MTKQKDRGGYVHPQPPYIDPKGGVYPSKSKGITLRDEFAKAAMQGLVTRNGYNSFKSLSDTAYQIADAMLEARNA